MKEMDTELLLQKVEEYREQAIEFRRRFHQIPELGFEETETTKEISHILTSFGIKPILLKPTGLVAYLGSDKKERKTLALRADIDALLIEEELKTSYCSKHPGKMHACGHDGHIAALLVAAKLLKEYEEVLPVRVKLLFQPSEENASGAARVIGQGVLEDVDEIFGLHLFSDLESGTVSVEEGARMAQTDLFSLTFRGKGGHAGKPQQCVDATVMAADFVMSAQTIVSREVNPLDSAVVTVGAFHSGTQYNIISEKAVLAGTARSFKKEVSLQIEKAIRRRAEAIAACYGGTVSLEYKNGSHPPLVNPKEKTEQIAKKAEEFLGKEKMKSVPPLMLGEDFSNYQTEKPGVFAFVGCGSREKGICYPNHHPKFEMEENALMDAVLLHLAAVFSHDAAPLQGTGKIAKIIGKRVLTFGED